MCVSVCVSVCVCVCVHECVRVCVSFASAVVVDTVLHKENHYKYPCPPCQLLLSFREMSQFLYFGP